MFLSALRSHFNDTLRLSHGVLHTHSGAAHEDNDEGPDDTPDPHQPGHSEEEDDAEDVLNARQVDAHQSAELGDLERNKTRSYSNMITKPEVHSIKLKTADRM